MKKLSIVINLLFIINSYSQKQITILDLASKQPIDQVKISKNTLESKLSSAKGIVIFEHLNIGDSITCSSKFFETKTILWNDTITEILLKKKSIRIKEAQIVALKPTLKVEAGKTTLETSQATIQQGTLKDLISQIPGAIIDNNGNISIKGKSGMRILVDNKTSQLANSDIKSFLESIPAGSIKSIEVMTNPGAQYDAEGKAGIISIKLKKEKKEGFNTKLAAGVGSVFNKYTGGIFTNYKNDQFNVFINYQFNYKDQWYGYSENRTSILNNITQYYDYIASWKDINRSHNIKTGIDLFINNNATLSYTLDINTKTDNGTNYLDNTSSILDENHNLLLSYLAYNKSQNNVATYTNALSYRQGFDHSKIEWTIDASHTYFKEYNTNINQNIAFSPSGENLPDQYYYFEPTLNNQVNNLMLKSDLNMPFKFAKIDIGLKNESNFNQNKYFAYIQDYGSTKYISDKYTNDFSYNENIFASYISLAKTIHKTAFDLGLRAENTRIVSNINTVNRNYLNFFPNIGLSTPIDSFSNFSIRGSRRIQRPNFNQLNNRIVYYNRYTANVGVPTLQPSISNVMSMQVDRTMMKGALNISWGVEFNYETNNISEYTYIDSTFTSYFTSGNIGQAKLFNTYLNIFFKPTHNLDINLTPQYLYSDYYSDNKGIISASKGAAFQFSGQLNYILPKQIKLSMNGFLSSNMVWAQGNSAFLGTINGSVSKSFLANKLNIEISCQDILNSNIWIGYQTTGNVSSTGRWKPETRIARLNISYTFGKKINYNHKEVEKSERIKSSSR